MNYPLPKNKLVDLGLPSGTLWAERNLGAISPIDPGLYYSWGNVDGHKVGEYDFSGVYDTQTNTWSPEYGNTQGADLNQDIAQLSEYDAAAVNLGNRYTMPTKEQAEELINNTTQEWETIDNQRVVRFTAPNGNSIIIPSGGDIQGGQIANRAEAFIRTTKYNSAQASTCIRVRSSGVLIADTGSRRFGMNIRPVSAPTE